MGNRSEVLLTKPLREPPLTSPQIPSLVNKPCPCRAAIDRDPAVICVIAQDVLWHPGGYQVKWWGQRAGDHIAKLAAERQTGRQRLVLQRSPALPEGTAPWAGYMVEMLRYMRHGRRLFIKWQAL
jgi:hypothetical protein